MFHSDQDKKLPKLPSTTTCKYARDSGHFQFAVSITICHIWQPRASPRQKENGVGNDDKQPYIIVLSQKGKKKSPVKTKTFTDRLWSVPMLLILAQGNYSVDSTS